MDNYFQLYKPYLRQAEQVDTRAAIQQHQENQRRNQKKEKRTNTEDSFFGDDEMTVSLQALKGLLKDLLNQAAPKQAEDKDSTDEVPSDQNDTKESEIKHEDIAHSDYSPSDYSATAVEAYQHAAETRGARQPMPNAPEHDAEYDRAYEMTESHNAAGMPADQIDVDRVRGLMDKTTRLQKAGYDHIEFVDRGDFLRSLERSIDELLSQ